MPYRLCETGSADADLARTRELLGLAFPGTHMDQRYLAWLYRENPAGEVIGVDAWEGDELAGHYAVVPLRARLAGSAVRAALSLNTAVAPAHRGRGLFTKLAEATYERARALGVDHVMGVANAESTPGFLRRLSFQDLGPLDARLAWRLPEPRDPEGGASWEREWEPAHLRWRLANPIGRYGIRRHRRAVVIAAATGWPGIRACLDALDPVRGSFEWLDAEHASARPALWLWLGRSRRPLRGPPGIAIPGRLRPSPLNVIFRPLQRLEERIDPDELEFRAIDFDAY